MPIIHGPRQHRRPTTPPGAIAPTIIEVFRRQALAKKPCLAAFPTDDPTACDDGTCDHDACWPWYGTNPDAVNALVFHHRSIVVPRLACAAFAEPLTDEQPLALHHCTSRGCWNPRHLFAASQVDAQTRRYARTRASQPVPVIPRIPFTEPPHAS